MGIILMLLIVEVFSTVVQRIFCENTLSRREEKKYIDIVVWSGYYIVFNFTTYFIVDSVLLNMLIAFASFFLAIRIVYINKLRTLLATTIFIYLAGMGAEVFLYFVIILFSWPFNEDTQVVYAIVSRLICFCIIKVTSLLVKRKREVELNIQDWLEVFMVPFGSIWILLSLFSMGSFSAQFFSLMAVSMVLAINIFTYYLYDKSKEVIEKRFREEILKKQCDYYIRQNKESQEWWEELRSFRHDMKQHYLLEKTLLEAENYKELERYCNENLDFISRKGIISNTGNIYVDSIINYKVDVASRLGIDIIADVNVPRDAELDAEDLCICLGNLLDNAIEASEVLTGEKLIKVKISTDKRNLFFNIVNQYESIKKENGRYLTRKKNSKNHGMGLMIAEKIANKYKGTLEIIDSNGEFSVTALLFQFIR